MNFIIITIENLEPREINKADNLKNEEKEALHEFKNNDQIVIKQADKGGAIVIMEREYYRDVLVNNQHLNSSSYEIADLNADKKVFTALGHLIDKHKTCCTKDEIAYLTNFEWKTSEFYVLPKIHKSKTLPIVVSLANSDYIEIEPPDDLTSRPIVAGPASPTQRLPNNF